MAIIQIILFEMWQSRNSNKYDKKVSPQHTIINKINTQLDAHISTPQKTN